MAKQSKVYSVSDEEFKNIIKNASTYSECLRQLGLGTRGGSSTDILKRRIQELNCDISHFNKMDGQSHYQARYPLQEILIENSSYHNISSLKRRLINEKIFEYRCAECGISEWRGKKISLQLHHKNGVNNDHRVENLEFLCPNCHSQTENFSGRNASVV